MVTSTASFTDSLERWIKAVRANDFDAAKLYAKHTTLAGELLVIHPDFLRAFHEHGNGVDPKEALVHLCQFLLAATDGRARHLKHWVKENGSQTV